MEFALGTPPLIIYLLFLRKKDSSPLEDKNRRFLRISFGYLWILDAFLQMQPGMNEYFASMILVPNVTSGGLTGQLAAYAFSLWNMHPVAFDVVSSLVQLYIGTFLLTSSRGRLFYWTQIAAILWGIAIWIFGEGFGGAFSPGATILTGFPGSAMIYVFASLILLPSVKSSSKIISRLSYVIGVSIFIPSLVIQILASSGFFPSMHSILVPMPGPPGILNFTNQIQLYFTNGLFFPDVITIVLILISLSGWFLESPYGYITSVVLVAFSWVVFEGFGILGILSTDPNTGLPLMLISIFFVLRGKKLSELDCCPREEREQTNVN
ncbi:MAG: hypothetical protein QXJ62_01600 [Nitrososphaeria archaeon]